MDFALSYLVQRFVFRLKECISHWYIGGTHAFWHSAYHMFRTLDRSLAFRITLRHLFQPLYGDYSIVGRIIGPFFRFGRILIGLCIYLLLASVVIVAYLLWIALPLFILAYGFGKF
jgi:hypothetical protein